MAAEPTRQSRVALAHWECGHVEVDDGSEHECDGRGVCAATYHPYVSLDTIRAELGEAQRRGTRVTWGDWAIGIIESIGRSGRAKPESSSRLCWAILVCHECGRAKDEHPGAGPRVCRNPKWQMVEVARIGKAA